MSCQKKTVLTVLGATAGLAVLGVAGYFLLKKYPISLPFFKKEEEPKEEKKEEEKKEEEKKEEEKSAEEKKED